MTREKLKNICELHVKWLNDEPDGKRANLSGANLYCADLSGANLLGADLYGANLRGAINMPFIPMSCPESGSYIGLKRLLV